MSDSLEAAWLDPARPLYVVSDIHSNLPALTAVLEQVAPSSRVLCAGDIVGYYIDPNPVIELLRARNVECILGNHDLYVLGALPYPTSREDKYRVQWTRAALSAQNIAWLGNLPRFRIYHIADAETRFRRLLLNHGGLSDVEEYIYPDTPFDGSTLGDHTLAIFGHTHHPMVREYGTTKLLNPGSVGQPRDRIPSASYARVNFASGEIDLLRATYDVSSYQTSLRSAGITSSMIDILSRSA